MRPNNDLGIDALDSYLDELGGDFFATDPAEDATTRNRWRAELYDAPDDAIDDLEDFELE